MSEKIEYVVFEINTHSGNKTFVDIPKDLENSIQFQITEHETILKTSTAVFAVVSKLDTISFSQIIEK